MGELNTVPMRINGVEGAAGQVKVSGGPGVLESWASLAPTIVPKTIAEVVRNSTVLQADDELLYAITANSVWFFELTLLVFTLTATPNIKFGWAYPTNCVIYWGVSSVAAVSEWTLDIALVASGFLKRETNSRAVGLPAGGIGGVNGICGVSFKAVIVNGANAGTVNLQWAQNTAVNEDTTVMANSHLKAYRVL